MKLAAAALLASAAWLAIAATPAAAQQAKAQQPEAPPVYTRAATAAEIKQAFAGIDPATLPPGRVTLSCRVKADGTFTACQIVSNTPEGRRRDSVLAFEGKRAAEIVPATVPFGSAVAQPETRSEF
jgi:hypothetical protein